MNATSKGFIFGAAVVGLAGLSFVFGGVYDRLYTFAPLDWLLPSINRLNSGGTNNEVRPAVLNSDEKTTVEIAETASNSVVTVAVRRPVQRRMMFGPMMMLPRPREWEGQDRVIKQDIGTGFVVTDDGLIVTNKHVVDGTPSDYLVIDKQNKEHKVLNIYRDPVNDLAILKVEGLQAPKLELGDSDSLKVGQQVIAIGTALGEFRHTVTTGVVSGLGRGIEASDPFGASVESLENVIQTDAAINPGNSGGPLLNSSGQVIGVNVAVSAAGQNIGFAIPINVIKASLTNFNQTGQFERPIFGIRYAQISERAALANEVPQGAYVMEVIPDTAASAIGLQEGDIITEFDGKSLKESQIPALMSTKKVGDRVKIKYWRDGQNREAEATLTIDQS